MDEESTFPPASMILRDRITPKQAAQPFPAARGVLNPPLGYPAATQGKGAANIPGGTTRKSFIESLAGDQMPAKSIHRRRSGNAVFR
jgi:hypothetical protein